MFLQLMPKERTVLTALFSHGPLSISDLAKITLIQRTTLYPIVEKLKKRGLVFTIKMEGKMFLEVISKHDFEVWLERQKSYFEMESDQLLEWMAQQGDKNGSVMTEARYYQGFEGVKALYGDTWRNNKGKMIFAITDYERAYRVMGDFFRKEYFEQRVKHGIKVRSLLPPSASGKADKIKAAELLREMRFVDLFKDLGIELNIYDDKIVLVAFDEQNPTGVLLKNRVMVDAFKHIFEFLWKSGAKA